MGKKAAGTEVASGIVSLDVYKYIEAYSRARDWSLSKTIGSVIDAWYSKKPLGGPIDALAREYADAEQAAGFPAYRTATKRLRSAAPGPLGKLDVIADRYDAAAKAKAGKPAKR